MFGTFLVPLFNLIQLWSQSGLCPFSPLGFAGPSLLKVDTFKKEYQLYENIKENKINMELADFIALDLFEALIIGLQAKNYKQI